MAKKQFFSTKTIHLRSVWLLFNQILSFLPAIILFPLLFLLLFYASSGFDITDESFYLLWASHPEEVLASVTQFGYYTGLLYSLSGEDIAIFRISGLLLLLVVVGFFSIELERYWKSLSRSFDHPRIRWQVVILLLIGSLAYYNRWRLTPSYNWLALISVTLVGAGLLRTVTGNFKNLPQKKLRSLLPDALLVGIGGGLAFMAKPTTALFLAAVTLYWLTSHPQHSRRIAFTGIAFSIAILTLYLHATIFKGGIIPFYNTLSEGMAILKIIGPTYSIESILFRSLNDVIQAVTSSFFLLSTTFFYIPFIFLLAWWNNKQKQEALTRHILFIFLISCPIVTWFQLVKMGMWSYRGSIGVSGLTIIIILFSLAIVTRYIYRKVTKEISTIPLWRLANLVFFLLMLTSAYAFGSGNNFILQTGGANIFLTASAAYIAFWIDQHLGQSILKNIVPAIISISILLVFLEGFNYPQRLPEKISAQTIESTFLTGQGSLYVDKTTAKYISELKSIALKADWKTGTSLIDLTGGSPGATFILGGKFIGRPWLSGGYSGSNTFAFTFLKMASDPIQQSAWILTAPKGSRKISNKILLDLGLNFPDGYTAVGKIKTGYRNEDQVLWKPLDKHTILPIVAN